MINSPRKTEEHKLVTLGYDVKITPEGNPYIIEINGKNSGLKGLDRIMGGEVGEIRQNARVHIVSEFDVNVREDVFGKKWEDLSFPPEIVSLATRSSDDVSVMSERYLNFLEKPEIKQWELLKKMYVQFFCWAMKIIKYIPELEEYFSEKNLQKEFNPKEILAKVLGEVTYVKDKEVGEFFVTGQQTKRQIELMKDFVEFYFRNKKAVKNKVLIVDDHLFGKVWFNPKHYVVGAEDSFELSIRPPFLKFRGKLKINSDELEEVCEDKLEQKKFIPEDYRAFYKQVECPFDPREFLKIIGKSKSKFSDKLVVVKKIKGGNCGNEVRIINVDDPINHAVFKSELWKGYGEEPILMEEFVPSKKIYCDQTGDYHDGCMRYLVDLHVVKKSGRLEYKTIYEAAYWRLAPVGLNGNRVFYTYEQEKDIENWKYKVNLANGAIPAKALSLDLETAREAVMNSVEMIMAKPDLF
ncbi:MAG: hypothetical protein ACRCZE_00535 [Candidatus Altimarinota bacterium]